MATSSNFKIQQCLQVIQLIQIYQRGGGLGTPGPNGGFYIAAGGGGCGSGNRVGGLVWWRW